MLRVLILLVLSLSAPSCSLVGDAVDISNRRSKELAQGAVIQGDGFLVTTPEAGLYPTRNVPGKGGVTFRPTEPMMDGLVYFVTPFPQARSATTRQALIEWNQIPARKGFQVKVLERKDTTYGGYPATEALVEVPQGPGGQMASILIVKTDSGFLVLNRGDVFHTPGLRQRVIGLCRKGLVQLKASTTIARR